MAKSSERDRALDHHKWDPGKAPKKHERQEQENGTGEPTRPGTQDESDPAGTHEGATRANGQV